MTLLEEVDDGKDEDIDEDADSFGDESEGYGSDVFDEKEEGGGEEGANAAASGGVTDQTMADGEWQSQATETAPASASETAAADGSAAPAADGAVSSTGGEDKGEKERRKSRSRSRKKRSRSRRSRSKKRPAPDHEDAGELSLGDFDGVEVLDPEGKKMEVEKASAEFKDYGFHPKLMEEIDRAGFKSVSDIQGYSFAFSLKNQDVVGVASTGSGKTLAFLLPAM
jgi:hypothetical protein